VRIILIHIRSLDIEQAILCDLNSVDSNPNSNYSHSYTMKTLIVIVLDESGSMSSKLQDVLGGYNTFLDQQKAVKEDQAKFILIKFNTTATPTLNCIPLEDVPPLTTANFTPGGQTALYDAISTGITMAEGSQSMVDRTIVVIMTDGEENSSKKTSKEQVKELIKKKESTGRWTFVYIGENPEAWSRETGMSKRNVVAYDHEDQGANFQMFGAAMGAMRSADILAYTGDGCSDGFFDLVDPQQK